MMYTYLVINSPKMADKTHNDDELLILDDEEELGEDLILEPETEEELIVLDEKPTEVVSEKSEWEIDFSHLEEKTEKKVEAKEESITDGDLIDFGSLEEKTEVAKEPKTEKVEKTQATDDTSDFLDFGEGSQDDTTQEALSSKSKAPQAQKTQDSGFDLFGGDSQVVAEETSEVEAPQISGNLGNMAAIIGRTLDEFNKRAEMVQDDIKSREIHIKNLETKLAEEKAKVEDLKKEEAAITKNKKSLEKMKTDFEKEEEEKGKSIKK